MENIQPRFPVGGGSVIYNTYKHLFIKTNYPTPESDIKLKLPFGFTLKYYIFWYFKSKCFMGKWT